MFIQKKKHIVLVKYHLSWNSPWVDLFFSVSLLVDVKSNTNLWAHSCLKLCRCPTFFPLLLYLFPTYSELLVTPWSGDHSAWEEQSFCCLCHVMISYNTLKTKSTQIIWSENPCDSEMNSKCYTLKLMSAFPLSTPCQIFWTSPVEHSWV